MKASILGGSGYVGGELLRLLSRHPETTIQTVTSHRYAGEPIHRVHPNLRGNTTVRFQKESFESTRDSDIVFTALPHGKTMALVPKLLETGTKVIDLAADYRLKSPETYEKYYSRKHENPELLPQATYGLPELHRDDIRKSTLIATPGCMATAATLGLAPIVMNNMLENMTVVVDAKIGSSGAGSSPSTASHHSERSEGVRPYKPSGHRHIGEIEQELNNLTKTPVKIAFSPHAVDMVRGILATSHCFTKTGIEKKDVWKAYRSIYEKEPFVRMVSDGIGLYGLPNPKSIIGTNYCDIGFDIDSHAQRIVVFTAIDNLTKGAAGQAVQCYNIINGFPETMGLDTPALHP
ncbi:N-acetyl-gamma-glutamyl-phosphate reductase [Candidatus Bathyarchaeota archaeon]|nr:N-acetyl-gamma-glutamyl-phosphate reductase [Candidatus Bathyarchaeota archaeon]